MKQNLIVKSMGSINRCAMSYLDRALGGLGLGGGSYPVLLCLASNGDLNQNRLSEELSVDKAWIARMVRRLTSLGYLEKRPDPEDARACLLSLSGAGRDAVPRIRAALGAWNALLCEGMDPAELAIVDRCLNTLAENARRYRSAETQGENAE